MTAIADLPVLVADVEVATNEDWRDSFAFVIAGSVAAYPQPGNTGNGHLVSMSVDAGAPLGNVLLQISSVAPPITRFSLIDDDGNIIGSGVDGVPYNTGGLHFTLRQGTVLFVEGDAFSIGVFPASVDLTGFVIDLQVRSAPGDPNVLLTATSSAGTLVVDAIRGVVGTVVPKTAMSVLPIRQCAFDMRARAGGGTKRIIADGILNVVPGITQG